MVLLDIRMPGLTVWRVWSGQARQPQIAVVIVTLYDATAGTCWRAIRRGAAGLSAQRRQHGRGHQTLHNVANGQLAVSRNSCGGARNSGHGAAGRRVGPSARRAVCLTPREHDVLLLVARALTNKEIGGRLVNHRDTVKKHVQNIIWKLRAAE